MNLAHEHCAAAFESTQFENLEIQLLVAINFDGASGPMDFDANQTPRNKFVQWKFANKQFNDVAAFDCVASPDSTEAGEAAHATRRDHAFQKIALADAPTGLSSQTTRP